MSTKFRRGLVAAATSLALVGTAAPAVAQGNNDDLTSAESIVISSALGGALSGAASSGTEEGAAGSALLGGTIGYIATAVAGIAITAAFWGTVYNALVSRGTVPGQVIPQLPVL